MKIKVIDAICGAGKTSYAIQMMNENTKVKSIGLETGILYRSNKKYIYVTPFLDEVTRVINDTKAIFSEPNVKYRGSKLEHLKFLIENGESIVMTHVLFSMLDEETLDDIRNEGYTLIMDEVANVLEQLITTSNDINYLLKLNAISIEEKGKVRWIDDEYNKNLNNSFDYLRDLADTDNLYIYNEQAMFWTMNVKAFTSFEEVYILTYLFDGQIQKYYYDLHEVEYEKYSVKYENNKYHLINYDSKADKREEVAKLLNIYEDYQHETGRKSTLNSNYDDFRLNVNTDFYLSTTWFNKAQECNTKRLNKNLYNYFRTQVPTKNENIFWTTKKQYASILKNAKTKFNKKDDRTKDNFISLNIRATNNYSHCTATAYVYNRFMNPMEKGFFEVRGIEVNENLLAVSDLVQFLFRGCIRNGEVMNCYIPSSRMRNLLYKWMNYEI
ncbi:hypothetical protein ERX37_03510 [Macrococcus hajekii]|uniref:Uncharacterized protein n=1 Tax=Macrococcus hajekii TaxID=198482 RepID=A0A4R6BMW4_9STAP|nr:hypothetical protein [Macrococcus hajekii]TDM03166.1 hypothetical protein ERX37_03510 [Macrococcus hajekii]